MSQESKDVEMVTINVDGQDLKVAKGTNIIEAAAMVKKEVPHYCYHPKLSISGNCRMCLVEMGMPMRDRGTGELILDDDGNAKIGWMPKPAIACGTQAAEGMHIKTNSENVKDCQEGVMEMLLVNHPLDCPICDQAGECRLQEFATDYGKGYSRFVEDKNVKPKRTVLGPRVVLDDERCILCSRCIRFSQEVANDDVLGFIDRGSYSTLTCYPGKQLENNYSLNTVDICPVGALTSTDFRFKMRVWFLKRTNSICTESSVGVNTEVWSREGKIYRITPRRNDEVNDTWMSDSGRAMYKEVEAEDRLVKSTSNGAVISTAESHIRFAEILPTGKTAYVGSGHMSVEEQYLFKKLVGKNPGKVFVPKVKQEGDELLISSDARPNMRGACATGLVEGDAHEDLSELVRMLEAGEIENLVVYQEDITQMGVSEEFLKKVNTVYFGTHKNNVSENACLAIPTLMVYERKGCFINQQGRLQKFDQAIPGPVGVLPDVHMLYRVLCTIEGTGDCVLSLPMLWGEIGAEIATLAGLSYDKLTDEGHLIDESAYAKYEGFEGKTLHYEPRGVSV